MYSYALNGLSRLPPSLNSKDAKCKSIAEEIKCDKRGVNDLRKVLFADI